MSVFSLTVGLLRAASGLRRSWSVAILALCVALPVTAQQQASIAFFPFGSLSGGDRWMADGLTRDLIEKAVRTRELRPVPLPDVENRLAQVLTKEIPVPERLPASIQRKVGQWLDADLVMTGLVGASGRRSQARAFLDNLSIVPAETPEGSQMFIAAKLIDVHLGQTVSWAFVEGSRDGFFELQDALYLQVIADLGIDPGGMADGTIGRPTSDLRAYRYVREAEALLEEDVDGKKRTNRAKRALDRARKALKLDETYAKAYWLAGRASERLGDTQSATAAYGQASALDPNYVAPRLALAGLARDANDRRGEMAALLSVLEAAPWHDDAHDWIARVHERAGETAMAADSYERALSLYDRDPDRLFRAGSTNLSVGRLDRAAGYLERAVARMPGETPYHVQLIRALTRADRLEDAKAAVKTAAGVGAESTDLWLAAGELAMELEDFETAEQAFLRVLDAQPGRTDAQLMVARLRSARGDHEAAIAAFERAIADGVPVEEVVEPLAASYLGIGRADRAEQLYAQALEQRPGETRWLLARARILIERMDHAGAIPVLRRVLEQSPKHADATEWIAGAYAAVGNDAASIRSYRDLLKIAPDRTHAWARLGDLHYRVRDFEASRGAYRKAVDGGIATADVYAGLGLAEEELKRYRSAQTAYRRALARDRGNEIALAGLERMRSKVRPPRREPTAADWAERGRSRRDLGDLDGAIDAFERSVAKNSGDAGVWNDLGTLYARTGNTARARTAFENAERLSPSAETAYNLGRLSFQENKTSEAMLNYQIALQRDERHLTAALNLAALQAAGGDAGSAIRTLRDIRRHHPENGAVLVSLANAHFQAGDPAGAAPLYKKARSLEGAAADAAIGLGNVALAVGDTTVAVNHYRSAIEAAPENPDPRVNLGTVFLRQGRYDEAVAEFERALAIDPSDLALYLNLAVLYYHTEQYAEALEYCRAIVERDPSLIEAQRLIGSIAMAMGEHDLAVQAYNSALLLDANDLASHLGIAEAYDTLGRVDEAHAHWQQWLDLVADDPAYEDQAAAITRRLEGKTAAWPFTLPDLTQLREKLPW